MPSRANHLAQADRNERLSQAISETDPIPEGATDWVITLLFYSALHLVDAFLDQSRSIHPSSHRNREWYLSTILQFRPIVRNYMNLYERSLDARYRLVPISPVQGSRIKQDMFQPIRSHVRWLLDEADTPTGGQ